MNGHRTTPIDTSTIDWGAADAVAERLGAHTRGLVAVGDPGPAIEWALRMAHECGIGNWFMAPRIASYLELAVLLGHQQPEIEEESRSEWLELAQKVEWLAGTVRAKANEEEKARAEAE